MNATVPKALAVEDLYPAVLKQFDAIRGMATGMRVLDLPAGQGAFANELLKHGCETIHCLDVNDGSFCLDDPRVQFLKHDAIDPLPFPDAFFDHVFSVEGIEHFVSPWTFIQELCRVLKPGGWLIVTTPNTFSVDARLKYLLSGYFPRFRPLMKEPHRVMNQGVDDAHIAPIYYWQLNYFLLQGNVEVARVSTNAIIRKRQSIGRAIESIFAALIRRNIRRRGFPDLGVTSDAMLFGDCIIVAGKKSTR